jgi:hypothetical protein
MAIATTLLKATTFGNHKILIHTHATPGTGANEIVTGATHVLAVVGAQGGTADGVLCLTPNTSDHSTAAEGSFTLEAEDDATCWTVAIVSG